MITVARLGEQDFKTWRALRLRGLREHPDAFGMPYEEEVNRSEEVARTRFLRSVEGPFSGILGAWDGDRLVGCFGYGRSDREKLSHSVDLWGMYVVPEARRQGVARQLLRSTVAEAGAIDGVRRVALCVTTEAAHALYAAEGFKAWGVEPCAMQLGEESIDQTHMVLDLG